MIPMFTLYFIAFMELRKATKLQLYSSNAWHPKGAVGLILAMTMNLHAERLSQFIEIINNIYQCSKPTKEALDDYPNDQSKTTRTEFATVAQRASSTFIILVLRVQISSFFNLFSTSKNCRFLHIFDDLSKVLSFFTYFLACARSAPTMHLHEGFLYATIKG